MAYLLGFSQFLRNFKRKSFFVYITKNGSASIFDLDRGYTGCITANTGRDPNRSPKGAEMPKTKRVKRSKRLDYRGLTATAAELVQKEQEAGYKFLAEKLKVGVGTVAKILKRLETKGLVRRGKGRQWMVLKNADGTPKPDGELPEKRRFRKKRRAKQQAVNDESAKLADLTAKIEALKSLQEKVKKIFEEHQLNYDITWNHSSKPFYSKPGLLTQACCDAIQTCCHIKTEPNTTGGTSDGRFIAALGTEIVELGLCNHCIHHVDEHTSVDDLEKLTVLYENILISIMSSQK